MRDSETINNTIDVGVTSNFIQIETMCFQLLFNSLGWDTSDVKDEELTLFLNAKLQGKYTYLLDFEHGKRRTKDKVRIIRAEEHPHFSPEWLTDNEFEQDILDRELTVDDLEIRSVVVENVVEVELPPPPPPTADDQTR